MKEVLQKLLLVTAVTPFFISGCATTTSTPETTQITESKKFLFWQDMLTPLTYCNFSR